MPRFVRKIAGVLALLVFLTSTSGCAALLGSRYNNFRAYYNTFYNAKKAFREGEESIEQNTQRVNRTRFISVFLTQGSNSRGPNPQFELAIEKSADLLRERPDSKYADDALLLIGKAYFYQQNYVGAQGKFEETIAAAEALEQFHLADEARFWLARTLTASESYDDAMTVLEEGLARENLREKWRARMQLAKGELLVQQRDWLPAAEALVPGIDLVDDSDIAGRAQFLLGQVYEAAGEFELAAQAYHDVERHRPIYELAYAAQLNEALVLGLDVGDTEAGLEAIRRMRRDDKNFQNRAEVELVYARLLSVAGNRTEANERFQELLYGDDFRSNAVRGETYYHYGQFFESSATDYVRASAYYDTAATNIREEPSREELITRTALTGIQRKAEVYRTFAGIATQIVEKDSLLRLGQMSEAEFSAAIASIEEARLAEWREEQERIAQRRAEQGFGSGPVVLDPGLGDGGRGEGEGGTIDAGYLNYLDPARVQDGMAIFQSFWGDRPLAPNWRRQSALTAAAAAVVNDGGEQTTTTDTGTSGGPPPLDLSNVPRTSEAQQDMRAERAQLRYELGNVFFLSLVQPDSAAFWYQRVINEDADNAVAVRALYALAEVHRADGRNEQADDIYRQVIERAPESELAANAREVLGIPQPVTNDSNVNERAESAYAGAYELWVGERFQEAFTAMLVLGDAGVSSSDIAPRALLAATEVYTDWAEADSFLITRPLPDSLIPGWLAEELETVANYGG